MKCLVINLSADVLRRDTFCRTNAGYGCEFSLIDAVDGRKLQDKWSHLSRWMHLTHEPAKFNIMPAIGCFLSHRKCWQHVVDEQLPWALVLEDDAVFTPLTKDFISAFETAPCGIDWLRLHVHRHPERKDYQRTIGHRIANVPLTVNLSGSKSNAAYIITRSGAEKALRLAKLYAPIDHLEWLYLFQGLRYAQTIRNIIEVNQTLPSSISGTAPNRLRRLPAIMRIGLIRSTLGWYANRMNWMGLSNGISYIHEQTQTPHPQVPGQ